MPGLTLPVFSRLNYLFPASAVRIEKMLTARREPVLEVDILPCPEEPRPTGPRSLQHPRPCRTAGRMTVRIRLIRKRRGHDHRGDAPRTTAGCPGQ